jgi:malonyl-CoA/methylmalonyl-CoA synthetase
MYWICTGRPQTTEFVARLQHLSHAMRYTSRYWQAVGMNTLGVAAVPIASASSVKEATYYVEKSHAAAVLASWTNQAKSGLLERLIRSMNDARFQSVSIVPCTLISTLGAAEIHVSSDRAPEENSPAAVGFTSRTTGPPKGAVMRRSFVSGCALSAADHFVFTEDDVMFRVLMVHHATSVVINLPPF